ncbi:2-oxoisovalerate dehydrogenase E1 component alpha subunit [Gracilibacillus halotolerans]|uniref:2-oxoisovalerate dehydrogenase subunit alpha n=1 Tax=Gracilibacillus halotolerans TaxID=74386 RepID=A0A841RKL1_9BACI|nr:thiamine pyrophosphate-dependent dehydrogenase E1 component subunit alpha [Gracilibacillus halotolerans]MBB6511735.1 2-oxoisovalerate dehydrogenase E1 component alpha subunit [Gracilibacillus halotolerans]
MVKTTTLKKEDKTLLLDMYREMLLARRIDERMWLLNRSGSIPFVVSCQGHEVMQVAASFALNKEKDYILPYYRDIGVVLHFGMTPKEIFLSAYAKAEDPNSGGRQMPNHFSHRRQRIVTGSSPVTTQIPHGAGFALASKMEGKDEVTFVTLGEGSTNQGDFHEGLNFASVHRLPLIVFVENNKYAISVPLAKQLACDSIADRAIGYGIKGIEVNGNDPFEVYNAVSDAHERALNGEGPTLVVANADRLTPHSSDDDDMLYRTKNEVDKAKSEDGVVAFREYLVNEGILTESEENTMEEEIKDVINEANEYAEKAPYPDKESLLSYVYGEEVK